MTIYTGDVLTAAEAAAYRSPYLLMVSRNTVLDVTDPSHDKGRYVTDGKVGGHGVNSAFGVATRPAYCKRTGRPYVSIPVTKHIRAGEEVLISYGPAYWGKDGFSDHGKRPACRKVSGAATRAHPGVAGPSHEQSPDGSPATATATTPTQAVREGNQPRRTHKGAAHGPVRAQPRPSHRPPANALVGPPTGHERSGAPLVTRAWREG